MSSLETIVIIVGLLVLWQLSGIRSEIKNLLEVAKDIKREFCNEYKGSGNNMTVARWGVRHIFEQIQNEITDQFDETSIRKRGVRYLLESIKQGLDK